MLQSFSIQSFRWIDTMHFSLGQKTYIQWFNGSWKTHVLDAIHFLSWSQPLYGNAQLTNGALLEWNFLSNWLILNYRLFHEEKKDIFSVQWVKITKPKYLVWLPWRTVYISPFDMNLLYFAPSMRRDSMDSVISRVFEQFSWVRKDYDFTMRQRNALLKKVRDGESKKDELDFWDHKFAELAELYMLYRYRYIEYVQNSLCNYPIFFGKYKMRFRYESTMENEKVLQNIPFSDAEIVLKYLTDNRERDIIIWHTHIWPHRDDWWFVITMDHYDQPIAVQDYLSRGEMKMILLWLRLIESEFIQKVLWVSVVILIDDIFAELDDRNSSLFIDSLINHQVILTSQKPLPNQEKHKDFICINLQDS